ncbi:MAG: esterase/lipase family protein [Nocardioidaceae bacterium]
MGERLPIVYVRGFAGGQSGIDAVVNDPFYGFNEGSTHIRVGAQGRPRFYQFEGPLLRLMQQQDYQLAVEGSQLEALLRADRGSLEPASLWVYRFYDESSGTFGAEPKPYDIGRAAQGLADFIELVRERTRGVPRVNLVAHSMGGLICRATLQRVLANPESVVSKLCTIGTPHGGIDPKLGGGVGDWIIDTFGPNGSDIFSPRRMRDYLLPAAADAADVDAADVESEWDPRRMVGTFSPQRVLSVVGTDAKDYEAAFGLSAKVMGEQSDGLVAIRNAYVWGSPRAYVHRSHSGRYGLVNSEETYQNLRRFLFGSLRVEIGLRDLDLDLDGRTWQADARLAIRGLPVLMHEQTADHHCPVDLSAQAAGLATPTAPVPLVTTFLLPGDRTFARHALHLKVISLREQGGIFSWGDHLEQIADWEDSLVVDVAVDQEGVAEEVRWQWNSELRGRIAEQEWLENRLDWNADAAEPDGSRPTVPLPELGRELLGARACVELAVTGWD